MGRRILPYTLVASVVLSAGLVDTPRAAAGSPPPGAARLTEIGHTDLGGAGLNGNVAVVGNTAIVGAGLIPDTGFHTERTDVVPCLTASTRIVDIHNPRLPRVVASIALPDGVAAIDVAAARVGTPSFSGDLAAIALDDGVSEVGPPTCPGSAAAERGIAYYDVSHPSTPTLLGRYRADVTPAGPPTCGSSPDVGAQRCALGQHSVALIQRPDRRVLSISVEVAADFQGRPSGDVRIVDVTNPRRPTQVGAWPPPGQRPDPFSPNGCRPFNNAHSAAFVRDGNGALVASMDRGLLDLDISDPSSPRLRGQVSYPPARTVEGNAAYAAGATVDGRDEGLASEENWDPAGTRLVVDGPSLAAGSHLACEAFFTLFDPTRSAPIHQHPGRRVAGEIAYVGRACPAREGAGEDPLLSDPRGAIALIDSSAVAMLQRDAPGPGCRYDDRVRRVQAAGALSVLFARVALPPFADSPLAVSAGGRPDGITIPAAMIDAADGDLLRSTLCPQVTAQRCGHGQPVSGALVDSAGVPAAVVVADIGSPGQAPVIAAHRTADRGQFPPPDIDVHSPGHLVARDGLAFVAWHGDGVRILDLGADPPREAGYFVPPPSADPAQILPAGVDVVGVAPAGDHVVITDTNSGLYVLDARGVRSSTRLLARYGRTGAGIAVIVLLVVGLMARSVRRRREPVSV